MSFMDPLGFSSYAISPAYPMQSMMEPAISPFGAFDPAMSSFGAFDPMSSFGAIDPMMSPFGSFNPGLSSYPAMQPQHYPPYPPRPPYSPMSSPYGDPSGGLSGMMGQLIQLFMSLFSSQNEPEVDIPVDGEIPDGDIPEEEAPVDNREKKIERLDPAENTEALKILSIYSKDLGAKGGYLSKEALEDFIEFGAKEKGVPDKVKQAAEALQENEALYNLLCLDSESDPESGFALSSLETDWDDDLEIDKLQKSPSSNGKALGLLSDFSTQIGALNTNDTDANVITRKDLEQLALGETTIPGVSDSERRKIQAAALKLLSEERAFNKLDSTVGTDGGAGADGVEGNYDDYTFVYNGTKDKKFTLHELRNWYEKDDD